MLSVGRIEPLKGLDLLVQAMSMLNDLDDTRLVIVGGRPERDDELNRLESMAAELGVADKTTFAGAVKQTELPAYYSAADVFVMPSYYESFGLVALEAMACGTPVIAARVGGLKSFITSGETAISCRGAARSRTRGDSTCCWPIPHFRPLWARPPGQRP